MATTEQILVHSAPSMNRANIMGRGGAMGNANGSPIAGFALANGSPMTEFALPEPLLVRSNVCSP